jgi:DNA-directed RNA polymerase subunit M/transcription elongation factor TFIIS
MLTEEQKKKYLADPYSCPYCGSKEISSSGDIEPINDGKAYQFVQCADCGKTWTDRYVLSDIEEDE